MLVDRPRDPILVIKGGKGDGRRVRVDYCWGSQPGGLPFATRVVIEVDGGEQVIGEIDGPFDSFEQISELAYDHAVSWTEKGNG